MKRTSVTALAILSCCCILAAPVAAIPKGAGRSFPIASENYAIDSFHTVNPSLEWDPTNFLVDLSGQYANCEALQKPVGVFEVGRLTPQRQTIVGVVDVIRGSATDVSSANMYIQELIKRWMDSRRYNQQIRTAKHVGCSLRPACDSSVVVACLFSPGENQQHPTEPPTTLRPTRPPPPPTRAPLPPTTTTSTTTTTTTEQPEPIIIGHQRALAFTPQQYKVAEGVMGQTWDQSHYLENLSGYETNCSMIDTSRWGFDYADRYSRKEGIHIKGLYGYEQNVGSTPDALKKILDRFEPVSNVRELGCSLIPDCIEPRSGRMFVVISCLFEENTKR